eukprot:jgi/Botrbrau1/3422/Bobra.139_1s0003.1
MFNRKRAPLEQVDSAAVKGEEGAGKVVAASVLQANVVSEDLHQSFKEMALENGDLIQSTKEEALADCADSGGDVEIPIDEEPSVQQLVHDDPKAACDILEKRAKKKLKTFAVKAALVKDLLGTSNCYAFGHNEQEPEDLEEIWRAFLQKKHRVPDKEAAAHLRGSTVDVDVYVVDIPDAAGYDRGGIVNPLLQAKACNLLGIHIFSFATVKAVVTFKWMCWARRYLLLEMAWYSIWLISFQIYAFHFVELDRALHINSMRGTHLANSSRIFASIPLVVMVPFIYMELCMVCDYGVRAWFGIWNCIDLIAYCNQIYLSMWAVAWLYDIGRKSYRGACGLQIVVLWVKVHYFARVLQPTGNPFVETIRESINFVKWFLILLLLLLWGFASGFYVLFGNDPMLQYHDIGRAMFETWNIASGHINQDVLYNTKNRAVGDFMVFLCFFSTSLILLKILVGLLSYSSLTLAKNSNALFTHGRAEVIDELELNIPRWIRRRHPEWYPRYVHFLKVDEDSSQYILPFLDKDKEKDKKKDKDKDKDKDGKDEEKDKDKDKDGKDEEKGKDKDQDKDGKDEEKGKDKEQDKDGKDEEKGKDKDKRKNGKDEEKGGDSGDAGASNAGKGKDGDKDRSEDQKCSGAVVEAASGETERPGSEDKRCGEESHHVTESQGSQGAPQNSQLQEEVAALRAEVRHLTRLLEQHLGAASAQR